MSKATAVPQLSQDSFFELCKVTTDTEFARAQPFGYDSAWGGYRSQASWMKHAMSLIVSTSWLAGRNIQ